MSRQGLHSNAAKARSGRTAIMNCLNGDMGYGLIKPDDGGQDVFVHISAVERAGMSSLHEGQKLTYDVVSERGKLAASNLQNA